MNKVINFKSVKLSCTQCSLSQLCMPRSLKHEEFDKIAAIVQRERPLKKGEVLFEIGQPFKSLFAVRSGSVKVYIPTNDGDEQIVGFHMPGELLGFDALGNDAHSCTAVALETSSICELPYARLHDLAEQVPGLNDHFMALMSNEIADEHAMMLMLGKKSGEARVAALLINISSRFHARGFSATQFNLSMSRQDMGNYLGLAVETVSRIFTHLQEEKMIAVNRKFIEILDMPRMCKLAGLQSDPCRTLQKHVE